MTRALLNQIQNLSREARNLLTSAGDKATRHEMCASDEKARGMGREALFQNGTFVILRPAVL